MGEYAVHMQKNFKIPFLCQVNYGHKTKQKKKTIFGTLNKICPWDYKLRFGQNVVI